MPVPSPHEIAAAAAELQAGRLVAFPTETVYGLGANALDPLAVARIFELKGRPRFDPLIVHLHSAAAAAPLVTEFPAAAQRLAHTFWPGPLTLVLPKSESIPPIVTADLPSVALRVPDHPVAQALLAAAGVPVAAPSANRFGRVSPTTADHVRDSFGAAAPRVLDGGPCRVGVESTVVAICGDRVELLRPGGVPREAIEAVVGAVEQPTTGLADPAHPAAPGMLASHYATATPLVIASHAAVDDLRPPTAERWGLLCLAPPRQPERWAAIEALAPSGDLAVAAANLFAAMRRLDNHQLVGIVAVPVEPHGLGLAILDRLRRAAARS